MMTKKLLVTLLSLSGCAGGPAVLNQAQLPVPEIEPLPSFPAPGYTPPGAGASPLGVPWQESPTPVERSPNKRLLPVDPTDPAPGLWAADAPKASTPYVPQVVDVELPLPTSDINGLETRICEYKVSRLLKSEGQLNKLMELSLNDRRCVIARLFEFCWNKGLDASKALEVRQKFESALGEIHYFAGFSCRYTRPGKQELEKMIDAITSVWDIAFKGKKR